jgi:uncharacterized protein (DUF488 family)
LFTIGYEGAAIRDVVAGLAAAGVATLVDVRALPLSRKPGFSKRQLAAEMEAAGRGYVHLRGLGTPKPGRDAARAGRTAQMQAIFRGHMATDQAQIDLQAATDLARAGPICLLCFERDPHRCHRRIVAEMITAATGQAAIDLLPEPPTFGSAA